MKNVFAKHEAEYIANCIENRSVQTYQISTRDRTYSFSRIRFGSSFRKQLYDYDDFLCNPPRSYSDDRPDYKSYNWSL